MNFSEDDFTSDEGRVSRAKKRLIVKFDRGVKEYLQDRGRISASVSELLQKGRLTTE
jgi:hypothetical protein